MWNKLKQLNKFWKLAGKDEQYLEAIAKLTEGDIDKMPNAGNGKAEFIKLMTPVERDEYIKNQQPVWKKFNERLKELTK
jgi:hypothetical protein